MVASFIIICSHISKPCNVYLENNETEFHGSFINLNFYVTKWYSVTCPQNGLLLPVIQKWGLRVRVLFFTISHLLAMEIEHLFHSLPLSGIRSWLRLHLAPVFFNFFLAFLLKLNKKANQNWFFCFSIFIFLLSFS